MTEFEYLPYKTHRRAKNTA